MFYMEEGLKVRVGKKGVWLNQRDLANLNKARHSAGEALAESYG